MTEGASDLDVMSSVEGARSVGDRVNANISLLSTHRGVRERLKLCVYVRVSLHLVRNSPVTWNTSQLRWLELQREELEADCGE